MTAKAMLQEGQGDSEEAALIADAKAYSPSAWVIIYQRHFRQIFSYAYHRVGDRDVAEDLAADVFAEAAARIHTFQYRGTPLLAWLYRIAHNLVSDYYRKRERRPTRSLEGLPEALAAEEDAPGRIDLQASLAAAIARLSANQQQVVHLRFLEGFNTSEVAEIMGKREGAVRVLQSRALKALHRVLTGESGSRGGGRP